MIAAVSGQNIDEERQRRNDSRSTLGKCAGLGQDVAVVGAAVGAAVLAVVVGVVIVVASK